MVTDDDVKLAEDSHILKNMDNFLFFGSSIEQLEEQIEKLLQFCKQINLKLSCRKFKINTGVKFKGMLEF